MGLERRRRHRVAPGAAQKMEAAVVVPRRGQRGAEMAGVPLHRVTAAAAAAAGVQATAEAQGGSQVDADGESAAAAAMAV